MRWKPRPQQIDPAFRKMALAAPKAGPGGKQASSQPASAGDKPAKPSTERDEPSRVFVPAEGLVQPVEVVVGSSDGTVTEISGEGVHEGMQVVVGEGHRDDEESDTTNPFMPQLKGPSQKPKQ